LIPGNRIRGRNPKLLYNIDIGAGGEE